MTTLTLDMMKKAMDKLPKPIPMVIKVGSPVRFREEMKKRGVGIEGREDRMVIHGVSVNYSPLLPENIAVVMVGDDVESVTNFDRPDTPRKGVTI